MPTEPPTDKDKEAVLGCLGSLFYALTAVAFGQIGCFLTGQSQPGFLTGAAIFVGLMVLRFGKLRSIAKFLGWSTVSLAALLGLYTLYARSESRREVLEAHAQREAERERADPFVVAVNALRAYEKDPSDENRARLLEADEAQRAAFRESTRPALEEARAEWRKRMTPSELAAAEARDRKLAALSDEEFDALGREPVEPPAEAAPEPREPPRAPQREPPAPRRPQPPLSTRI